MLACLPVLAVTFMTLGIFMKRSMEATQKNYAQAGGVAEETFSAMRTVAGLRAEAALTEKFRKLVLVAEGVCHDWDAGECLPAFCNCGVERCAIVVPARLVRSDIIDPDSLCVCMQYGLRGGYMTAVALGAAFAVIFLTYALGWWLGGYLISHGDDQACLAPCAFRERNEDCIGHLYQNVFY
jgi:hypothetical protein